MTAGLRPKDIGVICAQVEPPPPPVEIRRQVMDGIRNIRSLLPLGKKLTIDTLTDYAALGHFKRSDLRRMKKRIDAVKEIALEISLVHKAEVDSDHPSQIRVGPVYAYSLVSDDAAILLIGHELTHVAARTDSLRKLMAQISSRAGKTAGVSPTEDQIEDLTCDYIGSEVLKRYIRLNPSDRSIRERLFEAVGNVSEEDRLEQAWAAFCESYSADGKDEEHLGVAETFNALIALDPELGVTATDYRAGETVDGEKNKELSGAADTFESRSVTAAAAAGEKDESDGAKILR